MSWEQRLLDLFEDLEQQAEGVALLARDAEVAELARAEYSEIDLASRLHASVGQHVELAAPHALVRGRILRAGDGWCLVAESGQGGQVPHEWLITTGAVLGARGLSAQAQPLPLRPLTARLGLGSVLRRLAEVRETVTLFRTDGQLRRGEVGRVGQDFFELLIDSAGAEVVPFAAVTALRR